MTRRWSPSLGQLSIDHRTVVVGRYYLDWSEAQLAAALDIGPRHRQEPAQPGPRPTRCTDGGPPWPILTTSAPACTTPPRRSTSATPTTPAPTSTASAHRRRMRTRVAAGLGVVALVVGGAVVFAVTRPVRRSGHAGERRPDRRPTDGGPPDTVAGRRSRRTGGRHPTVPVIEQPRVPGVAVPTCRPRRRSPFPWRDGFVAGSVVFPPQSLPAELPPEIAALFPQEVIDLFAGELPATIDEATDDAVRSRVCSTRCRQSSAPTPRRRRRSTVNRTPTPRPSRPGSRPMARRGKPIEMTLPAGATYFDGLATARRPVGRARSTSRRPPGSGTAGRDGGDDHRPRHLDDAGGRATGAARRAAGRHPTTRERPGSGRQRHRVGRSPCSSRSTWTSCNWCPTTCGSKHRVEQRGASVSSVDDTGITVDYVGRRHVELHRDAELHLGGTRRAGRCRPIRDRQRVPAPGLGGDLGRGAGAVRSHDGSGQMLATSGGVPAVDRRDAVLARRPDVDGEPVCPIRTGTSRVASRSTAE